MLKPVNETKDRADELDSLARFLRQCW